MGFVSRDLIAGINCRILHREKKYFETYYFTEIEVCLAVKTINFWGGCSGFTGFTGFTRNRPTMH